ncbi:16S rRNA m(7)G-527 methyltransferase [Robiginitalea myxolifaciens]|uniref:Ribosomal RNA small subunit methyltransferase G n=1 Tax=Robiginitalea myxolifaciens TaxID=400055 RepID=A0A1I6FQ93_9FLAO|nr:16S rRNA (guanine(527)-N(7))-methyltransferase RsmG [Robiginitalea myxolifaciens]SFR32111.1 16S rRNA m(7)G-527 methyltransferase [Robiginitalea myxolifaciens]
MNPQIVFDHFPGLTDSQKRQFEKLGPLYQDWNSKINVVSRKDVEELYLRHVLHSLGIARVWQFKAGAQILDVGTGGGFPGIPLAICFPEVHFTLVDAIGKKIRVVQDVIQGLGLTNAEAHHIRAEDMDRKFDYVVSRAVAAMPTFVHWVKDRIKAPAPDGQGGILYLKGGDLTEELAPYPQAKIYPLNEEFDNPFFETKKVVYLPYPKKG